MNTRQIGRAGELLVQYKLLLNGVDSAPMTTDAGIDLVAYTTAGRTRTIQVKSTEKPKPGGGKGKPALDWWLDADSPADLIALVDLSTESVWLFRRGEFERCAQQHPNGRHHLYMYLEYVETRKRSAIRSFAGFLIENQMHRQFGIHPSTRSIRPRRKHSL